MDVSPIVVDMEENTHEHTKNNGGIGIQAEVSTPS